VKCEQAGEGAGCGPGAPPTNLVRKPAAPQKKARSSRTDLWIYLALFLATFATFAQVRHFDFVNFDDPEYVSDNPHVRSGITPQGVEWAITSAEAANWFPLTRLSHLLDAQLFGLRAGWHHLSNVFFHTLAALLLFAFLNRATNARWPSAFVALIFALHPLHVESVAWIAERKDVLSALFWFLALWAYVRYAQRQTIARYLLVVLAFCLGLMAKPMIVTMPFVLLLLDVWPLRRPRTPKLLWEKVPLLALSAAIALTTYLVQLRSGAVEALRVFPFGLRIANALVSYLVYTVKMFWPTGLAVFYPYPADVPVWQAALAGLVLVSVTALVLRSFRDRPYLAVGWLWYLGTLVPVIGLVQVGAQARADRYMYVPMVGLSIMLAWGAVDVIRHWPRAKNAIAVLASAACIACALVTFLQVEHWKNSETLFQHALDVTEGNYLAHHNLGTQLLDVPGRLPDAITHLRASLAINPDSAKAHTDLGTALSKIPDRLPEAIGEYEASLRLAPDSAITHNDLGNTLSKIPGRTPQAIAEFQAALRIRPDYVEAHNNLGAALAAAGNPSEAKSEYQAALLLKPDYAEARTNLDNASAETQYDQGVALSKAGRLPEAIANFEAALRLRPDYAEAHNNLGVTLSNIPTRLPEAIVHFEAALRIQPEYADAHYNLGVALSNIPGRIPEALTHLEAALRLKPDPNLRKAINQLRSHHR
jgi:tetratricopeptide (TPR) repeat protein